MQETLVDGENSHAQRLQEAVSRFLPSDALLIALVGLGILSFLRAYLANRALWVDEAALALNFRHPLGQLLSQPLEAHQVAPPGFLLAEWLVRRLLGESSYTLRLIPLLSASAALAVAAMVGRQLLPPAAVPFLLLFLISNDALRTYAIDVKQYASDVLWTLLIYWLILRWDETELDWRRLLALAAIGVVAIACSNAVLFVLAALGSLLGLRALLQRDWPRLARLAIVGAAWGLAFVGYYLIYVRAASSDTYLFWFWQEGFFPTTWNNLREPFAWVADCLASYFRDPAGLPSVGLAYAALAVGIVTLARERPQTLAYILAPLPFLLLASALRRYPLADRMLLFTLPLLGIPLAAVIHGLLHLRPPFGYLPAAALALALFWQPMQLTLQRAQTPMVREELPAVIAHVQERRQPGDKIYVYYGATHPFLFYGPHYGLEEGDYYVGIHVRDQPQHYADDLAGYQQGDRVWLLFSHVYRASIYEDRFILALMDARGSRLDSFTAPGASAYLYHVERPLPAGSVDPALARAAVP